MYMNGMLRIAQSETKDIYLLPAMANRHGLIAGATGTGKTITMKVMAESFSDLGVPVFFSDVKGDLSGMLCPGADTEDMQKRITRFGLNDFAFRGYPTRFWDIFGEAGHPVRVTVSDMGPQLLAELLGLTEVQAGVLSIVFKVADEQGCCFWTSRICVRCCSLWGTTARNSPRSTATFPRRASVRSSVRS